MSQGLVDQLVVLGMGSSLPPLMTGILISWGPINPDLIGLMTIPYSMEIMGVFPDPIAHIGFFPGGPRPQPFPITG